jgi:hypothetical protein
MYFLLRSPLSKENKINILNYLTYLLRLCSIWRAYQEGNKTILLFHSLFINKIPNKWYLDIIFVLKVEVVIAGSNIFILENIFIWKNKNFGKYIEANSEMYKHCHLTYTYICHTYARQKYLI